MKIVEINGFDRVEGGAESYLATVGREMLGLGHKLSHIYITKGNGGGGLIDGIPSYHVPELSLYGPRALVMGRFGRGVRSGIARLRGILREERPDVIHVHNVYYPVFLSALRSFAPVIRTVHDYRFLCPNLMKLKVKRGKRCYTNLGLECFRAGCLDSRRPCDHRLLSFLLLEREVSTGYDRCVAKSAYMRDVLVGNGFPAERVSVVPLCVAPVRQADAVAPADRILFAGRMAPEKGLEIFCRLMLALPERVRATVAGGGVMEEETRRLVDRLGVSSRVDFTGWLSPGRMSEEYRKAAVVVIPSLWSEPFGLVGLEAMAHRRPVVAFNVGGIPEWLEHGKTGFAIEPGDTEGLAYLTGLLLEDRALARAMGSAGVDAVTKRFSPGENARMLVSLYEEAVCGNGRPRSLPADAGTGARAAGGRAAANCRLEEEARAAGRTFLHNYPRKMTLAITTRCNMDPPCVMCSRNVTPREWEGDCEPCVLERVRSVFPYLEILYLHCSGEPLFSGSFEAVLQAVKPPTKVRFNTNGLLLDERMARLVLDSGVVDVINFSVDAATAGTYARIRSGDFERVTGNVRRLARMVRERKVEGFTIVLNMCVMRENIAEVPAFIDLAEAVGARGVDLFHLNEGYSWRCEREGFAFDYGAQSRIDAGHHNSMIKEAYRRAYAFGITLNFIGKAFLRPDGVKEAAGKAPGAVQPGCTAPWSEIVVGHNGRVRFCCYHPDSDAIGDLSREDFWSVWNGERARRVRAEMISGRLAAICLGSENRCVFRGRT